MKPIRLPLLSTTLALCLFCMTAFTLVSGASAHTVARNHASNGQHMLNGSGFYEIDLNAYCQALGYPGVSSYLQEYDVYGWRCVDWSGNLVQFSLHDACRWSLNSYWGADVSTNFYDPYSVRCFIGSEAGSLDIKGYCQSMGELAQLGGTTDYDWWCRDAWGNHNVIDYDAACQWQFGASTLFARFDNFYMYDTWQCWGFGTPV